MVPALCVKGKCVAGQHLTKDKEESRLSTVHVDYCFLFKKKDSEKIGRSTTKADEEHLWHWTAKLSRF